MLVNIKEAARLTGLSEYELRTGTIQGRYPYYKAGAKRLFDVEALQRLLVQRMEDNQQQAAQDFARYRGMHGDDQTIHTI